MEPPLTVAGLADLEPILDVLPVPLLFVEPGTARILYANAAAQTPAEAAPAAVRAARRGEPLSNVQLDYEAPGGPRSLVVSGDAIRLPDGRNVIVMTFEDVTELEHARREAARSRDDFRAMLEGVADAVTVQAPDHGLIYANEAACRLYGLPRDEELAGFSTERYIRAYDVVDEAGRPLDLGLLPGRLALAGADPEPIIVRSRERETGIERWSRIKATAVRERDGHVRLAINLVEDITELKRSEQAQRFLADASRTLAGSLDYERTLAAVASLAVPAIADWCIVDLAGDDGHERVVAAHTDPARRALAEEMGRRYPPRAHSRPGVAEVLRTGVARLVPEVDDAMLRAAAIDEEHLRVARSLGIRSAMLVPMTVSGRVIGVITLVSAESARRYDGSDLAVAEDLGLRAAAAVENARLYRTASENARTLQTSLLPPRLPDVPGVELAAAYRPAGAGLEVGGDFYDVFSTIEGQWYLVIGDVCGKGAEAAAVTALARFTVRTAAVRQRSPAAILRWVGDAMLDQEAADGRFCTIACAQLDLTQHPARVTVACGGHPLPLLVRAGGAVEPLGFPGTLLGLVPDPELRDRSAELGPGDGLVLYTDGLTEAHAPARVWGPDDLAEAVRAAAAADAGTAALVERLVAGGLEGTAAPRDDIAVLALRYINGV